MVLSSLKHIQHTDTLYCIFYLIFVHFLFRQKQCIDKYGPNFILSRPFLPALMFTADPVVLKHIMKDNFENYPKGNEMIERFEDLLGHGIFNADGHLWKEQRVNAFSFSFAFFFLYLLIVFPFF